MNRADIRPILEAISAARQDEARHYGVHPYFTRRPANVVRSYVERYSQVDDVVLGCVTPVGEQGADIARTAVLDAEWAQTVAGVTQSRFCASGLESVNLAAAKVASGFEDLVVGGGVESMSRWKMGSDGGAWAMDPRINQKLGFVPQGVGADLILSNKKDSHMLDPWV